LRGFLNRGLSAHHVFGMFRCSEHYSVVEPAVQGVTAGER
jgi:hypothetical protein